MFLLPRQIDLLIKAKLGHRITAPKFTQAIRFLVTDRPHFDSKLKQISVGNSTIHDVIEAAIKEETDVLPCWSEKDRCHAEQFEVKWWDKVDENLVGELKEVKGPIPLVYRLRNHHAWELPSQPCVVNVASCIAEGIAFYNSVQNMIEAGSKIQFSQPARKASAVV